MNRISFLNRGYAFKGLLAVMKLVIGITLISVNQNSNTASVRSVIK